MFRLPDGNTITGPGDDFFMERPEYVFCLGERFLSEWAEADLRRELANYKRALQAIALEEDQEKPCLIARQALADSENAK